MTRLEAHVVCLGLVAADLLARAYRIRWLLRATGSHVSVGQSLAINAVGDAACALTPLRLGGEPARVGAMLRAGLPLGSIVRAVVVEVVAAWPVLAICGAWLGLEFAPEWWRTAARPVAGRLLALWPWELAAIGLSLGAAVMFRRARGPWRLGRSVEQPARIDRSRLWLVVASAPMSFVNVASRAALLPVLALTLPTPPDLGVTAFGSLMLLYGQLVLPTPSGAGVVDLALLAGVAGRLGGDAPWVLGAWRFYTVGCGVLLGACCCVALRAGARKPLLVRAPS